MIGDVRLVMFPTELDRISRSPEIRSELIRQCRPLLGTAKSRAPVSRHGSHGRPSGYLRSKIILVPREDDGGWYVDLATIARTPRGFRYGAFRNAVRPYLGPAI